jgi:hypothetical protein
MQVKTFPARVKTVQDGLADGEFEALVSVFGNVDLQGDRVMPGAYAYWLGEWKASGDPLPVIWSHQHGDLNAYVGESTFGEERPEGLMIRGKLDLDDPAAVKVYKLLKGRRVNGWSFAYDVLGAEPAEDAMNLTKLWVYEVGPCLLPANEATQTLVVKGRRTAPAQAPVPKPARKDSAALVLAAQQRLGAMRADLDAFEALFAELAADELAEPDDDDDAADPAAPGMGFVARDSALLTLLALEDLAS